MILKAILTTQMLYIAIGNEQSPLAAKKAPNLSNKNTIVIGCHAPICYDLDFWGTGCYEWVTWQHEAGYAYMCKMQVRQTWLQLHRGGELCLPCCIVSIISETDTECIYDDQT